MKNKRILIFFFLGMLAVSTGCGTENHRITIDGKKALETNGTYTTQTRLSALEYSIFMSKQITVFTNQLSTFITMAKNSANYSYDADLVLVENARDIMQDAYDEVLVTFPSQGSDQDRETALTCMETAILHTDEYIQRIRNNESTTDFPQYFENDFLALTSLASLYYQ